MRIEEVYELYQFAVAYVALFGAVSMFAVALWLSPLGVVFRRRLEELWTGFRRLGSFGQIVVVMCLIGVCQYGSTKGFWSNVKNSGGDDILTVTGIYTGVSNVVDDTVSPPVTNQVPMVRVEWLGNGGTSDTPVSVRASQTNEWSSVQKIDPVISIEGITNVLQFATTTNLANVAYWWFGHDLPAVVITEEGIEIREKMIGTKEVYFKFVCGEREATEFILWRKKLTDRDWTETARMPAEYGKVQEFRVSLFTVDVTHDWKITTEIRE